MFEIYTRSKNTKIKMVLKKEIKQKLIADKELRKKIAEHRGVDTPNIYRLFKNDSELLTTLPVIKIIKKHTGLKISELFEI